MRDFERISHPFTKLQHLAICICFWMGTWTHNCYKSIGLHYSLHIKVMSPFNTFLN